ncbi:hypothetical protein [Demequina sp.]|uniref:hypothetical protein n=1 Tax=Demequina sp. TaxID=2050685 RepID=UPI0025B88807|nr:hypothetical protein [Demequina sp.]
MNEDQIDSERHKNVQMGIDGKPFEVWTPQVSETGPSSPPPAQGGFTHTHDNAGPQYTSPAREVPAWEPEPTYERAPIVEESFPSSENTLARNSYAWLSIGLGGASLLSSLMVYFGTRGGLTWTASIALALAGLYFGLRSRSVNSRGFSPQSSLGIAGISISVLAVIATVALVARFLTALSRIF